MKILIDGPDQILYQWDKGQRLMLHGADAGTRVDFARCDQHKAVSVYAYAEDGAVFCDIPDALLMEHNHLHGYVYEIDGDRGETVREFMLPVIRRPMPEDYVAPDEVLTWHELEQRIKKIEDEGVPDEKIAQAVEDYLEENPVQPGGSAGTVEIADVVDRPPGSPPTVTETEDSTPAARKYILGIPRGSKGVGIKNTVVSDSPDGYTSVTISYTDGSEDPLTIPHGKDYVLTPADKAEIAEMAAELVEVPEQDSSQNVNPVPKTDDMTQPVGIDADGRLWVAPIGGGSSGGGDTGGDSGGDTGGGETTDPVETPLQVTWVNGSQKNGIVTVSPNTPANVFVEPLIDGKNSATKIVFRASADYLAETPINQVRLFLYSDAEGQNFVGSWNLAQNAVAEGDTATQSVDLDTAYIIPAGYYVRVFMSKGYNPANFSSNANLKSYATGGFVEFYAVSAGSAVGATALSVDDDYAMNYGVSTMSLVVDDMTSAEASNAGIDQTFANTVISAMNSWMKEYRGNINKIPLIIHTDQHGRLTSYTKPLFDLLNSKINWYEVSKIMNLGDTVSDRWIDTDSAEPLLECTDLEHTLECLSNIPFSKRLDVFGNHDTWYTNADGEDTVLTDFPHLSQYFKNIYARRTNNHGWFTVKDDYFNVKYVVISGFEYTTSRSTFRIGTEQMKFIIDEFGKDDGYDIIVVSHVPIWWQDTTNVWPTGMETATPDNTEIMRVAAIDTDSLFNARKNKTSGTVTDSDGVVHNFDFSDCSTDVLCGLHGHVHIDGYNYVGGAVNGLLNVGFDWFDDNTIHFVLVDRENRQVDVWKVDSTNTVQSYQVPMDKLTA